MTKPSAPKLASTYERLKAETEKLTESLRTKTEEMKVVRRELLAALGIARGGGRKRADATADGGSEPAGNAGKSGPARVARVLREKELTAPQAAAATGISTSAAAKALTTLVERGKAARIARGIYAWKRDADSKATPTATTPGGQGNYSRKFIEGVMSHFNGRALSEAEIAKKTRYSRRYARLVAMRLVRSGHLRTTESGGFARA